MANDARLSLAQLVGLAQQAGWSAQEAPKIAAIAMAESGGRPGALNDNPGTGDLSYGLTQVNMIGGLGPERRRQFGLESNEQLKDPLTNLRAAKAIRESQGWNAWSVHKSGAYQQFLPGAQQALGGQGSEGGGSPLAGLELGVDLPQAPAQSASRVFNLGAIAAAGLGAGELVSDAGGGGLGQRFAGRDLATAMMAALLPKPAASQTVAALGNEPALPAVAAASSGGTVSLVDFGKGMRNLGLKPGEHSAFGSVGKHSPNSWHDEDKAIDFTDWNSGDWKARKRFIGEVARQALGKQAEIFHPGYDPVGGHHSHIHLAVPSGQLPAAAAEQIYAGVREAFRRFPRTAG